MQELKKEKETLPQGSFFNWSLLTGFDIFVSYRRGIASPYADSLRNALAASGFKCFLDEREPDDTVVLKDAIRKTLHKSAMMIVIAEASLTESKWVPQEIAIARGSRKIRIVPINIGGWLAHTRIDETMLGYLQSLAWLDETQDAFLRGVPSPHIVRQIDERFTRVRVNTRTRGITAATIAILAASTLIAVFQRNSAVRSEQEAKKSLVRLAVANGTANIDDGYLWAAWMWFTEALRISDGADFDAESHRLRLSQVRKRLPELRGVWLHAPANYVAFLPDDRFLTADANAIRVWRLDQTTAAIEIRTADARLNSVVSDLPGEHILAFSDTHGMSCWSTKDGGRCPVHELKNTGKQGKLFTSETFAAIDKRYLIVRNLKTGSEWLIPHDADVDTFALSPSGRIVVTVSGRHCLLWDVVQRKQLPTKLPETSEVVGLAISPGDSYLAVTTRSHEDLETTVWDIASGTSARPIRHETPAERWEFEPSPGGAAAATFSGGAMVNRFEKLADFSPDGQQIYTISRRLNSVRVWDWRSGDAITPPLTHLGNSVYSTAFSPDGELLATTGADGSTRI